MRSPAGSQMLTEMRQVTYFSKVIIHWLLICNCDYFEKEEEKNVEFKDGAKNCLFYTCFEIEISVLLFFLIDLYWSIIDSQYCVSFCCTPK